MGAEIHHEVIHYTGHVQGVGFRYTTTQVAKEFEVCGYVSNLADGRVLLEVEGQRNEVKAFTAAVAERLHGYIRKTEQKEGTRSPSFTGFTIK
ncbi:MAG TPA: acylphosphatase [Opitutaceae bacterium]|nr:acylphosphatase [Opitutaceae bacterium]